MIANGSFILSLAQSIAWAVPNGFVRSFNGVLYSSGKLSFFWNTYSVSI